VQPQQVVVVVAVVPTRPATAAATANGGTRGGGGDGGGGGAVPRHLTHRRPSRRLLPGPAGRLPSAGRLQVVGLAAGRTSAGRAAHWRRGHVPTSAVLLPPLPLRRADGLCRGPVPAARGAQCLRTRACRCRAWPAGWVPHSAQWAASRPAAAPETMLCAAQARSLVAADTLVVVVASTTTAASTGGQSLLGCTRGWPFPLVVLLLLLLSVLLGRIGAHCTRRAARGARRAGSTVRGCMLLCRLPVVVWMWCAVGLRCYDARRLKPHTHSHAKQAPKGEERERERAREGRVRSRQGSQ
jgi:hypothetical protein